MTLPFAKVLLAPLCVVAVSLAGRRWGIAVAGLLGGLPVVAGPILLAETLIHGGEFGADAAAGTLLGLAALILLAVQDALFLLRSRAWASSTAADFDPTPLGPKPDAAPDEAPG